MDNRRKYITANKATQRLADDLKRVIRDTEELLAATAGEAGERVQELRVRLATAVESATATCQRLQEETAEAARTTDHVIREHPYESIGIGFEAGLLAGLLISVLVAR